MKILVFDIGGTAIKYGICKNGHLEETKEYPTEAFRGGTHILNTICRLSEQYLPFDAIGISTAGQVNPDEGSIIYANSNIPDYTGTQFKKILQKLFHVPVAVENDVNSAALGEAVFGAGKGKNSFLCLTYGTGVGGAIIENKQVYHGSSFSAGEFGAIITHAEEKLSGTDPFDGCYERYASATALVKMVSTVDSSLTNGRQIFASLKRPEINEVINKWIDEIVLGLATLIHIFNPSCIVLGGGGAIIENKQVYHGSSFSAGEFGAIITHAEEKLSGTDPFDGCYERYASATALVKMVSTVDSSLTNGRQIFASLKRPEINEVINKWIDEIVLGLATLIHIFNPSCIVLGGGIMVQPYILERIHTRIPQMVMSSFTHVQISNAKLGNSAGLMGAYYLASQKL